MDSSRPNQGRKTGLNLPIGMNLDTFALPSSSSSSSFQSHTNISSPSSLRSISNLGSPSKSATCSDRFIPCRSSSRLHTFGLIDSPVKEGGNENYSRLLKAELFGPDFGSPSFAGTGGSGSPVSSSSKNMLRFKTENSTPSSPFSPTVVGHNVGGVSPGGSTPPKQQRKIPKTPFKILDAPSLQDDFYLNLVDWSSQNVLAVALGTCVYLWSATSSKVTKLCDLGPDDGVCSVQWTKEGSFLSIGTSLGQVQVCGLHWSHDDRELASGGNDNQNQIMVWKYPTMGKVATLTGHSLRVLYLAMSPDGQTIVTGAGDETLRFWNVFPSLRNQAHVRDTKVWSMGRTHIR
ncbi:hypothetical protein MKX01_036882 [Papaver californicum]|nr:hypothetical protein MKX01_036882 [Papaver californicum]